MFEHAVDDRTRLAMIERRDAEPVYTLVDQCRSYLREWLPWVDHSRSVEDTRAYIETALKQHASDEGFQCVIRYDGEIAGMIGFRRLDWANRIAEIGYWLGEEYQGRGIMTACCRALVDFAFREYGLNRVEIHVATGNVKSRAIPERLGFTCEGVLRDLEWVNDHFVDGAVYAMLRREWKERGQARRQGG
jgi:ribosomal-protein-serine acetyltransferase